MSLYEENGLPGVLTEVVTKYAEDYDTSQFGVGDSVCIVGTAFDGVVGKPVKIYSPAHAKYLFGPSFNSKTRKEATLVAEIQNAWDRGCRTIYAVRIGGKDIYKDYQLKTGTKFKLRVSGLFPSNENKDIAMTFDKTADGDENVLKIYKPASRATIKEKKLGLVERAEQVLVNEISLEMMGLSMDDELVDLIKTVNSNHYNNVIKLSIVDEEGNDVTLSAKDTAIKISDMFYGIYLIGRSVNKEEISADTRLSIEVDAAGKLNKTLEKNTNVSKDIPLYDKNLDDLLGVPSAKKYNFLTIPNKLDDLFLKDNVDYEEVDMTLYEAYEKLGSGYAVNAEAVVVNGKVKVKEVTDKDRKISPIKSGVLSMLENLEVDYRVLAGVNADDKIKGRLPKPADFKIAKSKEIVIDEKCIKLRSKVDKSDLSVPKLFKLSIEHLDTKDKEEILGAEGVTDTSIVAREATIISQTAFEELGKGRKDSPTLVEGALVLLGDSEIKNNGLYELFSFTNGELKSLHTPITFENQRDAVEGEIIFADGKLFKVSSPAEGKAGQTIKKFAAVRAKAEIGLEGSKSGIIVSLSNDIFMAAVVSEAAGFTGEEGETPAPITELAVKILGTCNQIFNAEDDMTVTAFTTAYNSNVILGEPVTPEDTGINEIKIKTNEGDFLTVDELAQKLINDEDFSKLYEVIIINESEAQKYVNDVIGDPSDENPGLFKDAEFSKEVGYDMSKLIRFRTTDNFARLLAQHCAYSALKTAPTHGIIGTSPLLNTSLDSIENKVQSLIELGLDKLLVAKKDNGQNMLNKDSIPYNIGKNISIICCQYPVVTGSNYTYISNAASGYAGMVSRLPIDQSSTCQPISIPRPTVTFNNYQLKNLTNAGYVTVKESQTQGLVITDGVTMAPAEDIFRRLSCCRISNAVDSILRETCEPFIGKQNTPANQNSLRTAIKSKLENAKGFLIEGFEFNMNVESTTKQMGKINIFYRIVPIYEIKEIKNHLTI